MLLVFLYSLLLIVGIICSQLLTLGQLQLPFDVLTKACLAVIMIEVGRSFVIDQKKFNEYGWDFFCAFFAAALPWVLCSVYLLFAFPLDLSTAFLIGIFAAPTSAGILFAMLAAAGLSATWVFRKAQILAIFDDIVSIAFLVLMQIICTGFKSQLALTVVIDGLLLWAALRWHHQWRLPTGKTWIMGYCAGMAVLTVWLEHMHIGVGVILPAFIFGTLMRLGADAKPKHSIDQIIEGLFMFLVGLSLPQMQMQGFNFVQVGMGVLTLTILSNLGKCFLFFSYRGQASWRERLALSIAMLPRGEVGAGVLLVALAFQVPPLVMAICILSLALNLILTGGFIAAVLRLHK